VNDDVACAQPGLDGAYWNVIGASSRQTQSRPWSGLLENVVSKALACLGRGTVADSALADTPLF
jgi:hypothetical protein